ncbi:MAG TPA: hypothetical protein VIP11_07480 [Gemmatimonadaceae bacterium]
MAIQIVEGHRVPRRLVSDERSPLQEDLLAGEWQEFVERTPPARWILLRQSDTSNMSTPRAAIRGIG